MSHDDYLEETKDLTDEEYWKWYANHVDVEVSVEEGEWQACHSPV